MKKTENKARGEMGESEACRWLETNGFEIVERNYRTRLGEIDIVARKDGIIHLVEVKARWSDARGTAREALTAAKRKRMRTAGEAYVYERDLQKEEFHYDLLALDFRGDRPPTIEFFENALAGE